MNRQLSAERTRRAVITESEGNRQSAINVAEGAKQSEILRAEGDRQAAILRAEGFGLAIERIFQSASQVDQKTMALQYLETLKSIGASPSTKYVLPLEVTQLGEAFRGYLQASNEPSPRPPAVPRIAGDRYPARSSGGRRRSIPRSERPKYRRRDPKPGRDGKATPSACR